MTADLTHLVERRDLAIPDEDHGPLSEYWNHLRQLRAEVDDVTLDQSEIAVVWTAVTSDG